MKSSYPFLSMLSLSLLTLALSTDALAARPVPEQLRTKVEAAAKAAGVDPRAVKISTSTRYLRMRSLEGDQIKRGPRYDDFAVLLPAQRAGALEKMTWNLVGLPPREAKRLDSYVVYPNVFRLDPTGKFRASLRADQIGMEGNFSVHIFPVNPKPASPAK